MRLILNKMIMKNIIYVLFVGCLLLSSCGNGSSSKKNDSSNDEAILTEMLQVHEQRQALMSRINSTYNRYRQQMSSGSAAAYASEAGMWQLREEMEAALREKMNQCRRAGEEASTKLLIPMVMILGIIMVIIMVPAFGSF